MIQGSCMTYQHGPYRQIIRTSAPTFEEFKSKYFLKQQPVIITDLFQDQPIRQLSSLAKVKQQLGETSITISEGFRPEFFDPNCQRKHSFVNHHSCTISDYLNLIEAQPNTFLLCLENELPVSIRSLINQPDYCQAGDLIDDTVCKLFIGNKGNYSHLHYDSDGRHVLFYQATGQKRLVIIPADASPKVVPHHHWGLTCLEHFDDAERNAFLDYVGGVQCILEAGETLYFPAASWHYVDYLTDGLSVALRFGRNAYTQFLAEKLHPDSLVQRIIARFQNSEIVKARYQEIFDMIVQVYHQQANNVSEKQKQVQTALKQAWQEIESKPDKVYQIPVTPVLEAAMDKLDAHQYHQFDQMAILNGWQWRSPARSGAATK